MAAGDLCTIADVRGYMRIQPGSEDTLLKSLITAASRAIANVIDRSIATTAFVEKYNGNDGRALALNNRPITGVTYLKIDGNEVPARPTPSSYGYSFSDNCLYLDGYNFTRGRQNVEVSYQSVFTVQDDLKLACVMLVDFWAHEHDRCGVRSRVLGPSETTVYDKAAWPKAVEAILLTHNSRGLLAV